MLTTTSVKCQRISGATKMDVVLLLIIAASGLRAVSPRGDRQYHVVYEQKTWTEAQSHCRKKYTDLATIDSTEDVEVLNHMVDLSKMGMRAWIGLYDAVDSWRWSLSDTSFYKRGETEFRLWGSGEPNNQDGQENCTVMSPTGLWYNTGCGNIFKSACMDVRGLAVKFVLIDKSMNMTEAQSLCRAHYTDLASVRNMEDNQKVMELVPSPSYVWIGLSRDIWKWSDGSNPSFTYWKQSEPSDTSELCVLGNFGNSGRWEDWPCGGRRGFICYSPRTTKRVIKLRLLSENPSLDLNDPAVMGATLKQLKQKLKDQGLNGGIRLSWRKQPDGQVFHEEEEETKKRKARTNEDEH